MSSGKIDQVDPTRVWTRQLAQLRGRALKLGPRRVGGESAVAQIAEDALGASQSILQELAGQHLECERLRREARSEAAAWDHLFAVIPAACVITDQNGFVLNANKPAGVLLNLAPKSLKGRELIVFSEDRAAFGAVLQQVANGRSPVQASVMIRPRERKPSRAQIIAVPASPQDSAMWLWFLIAAGDAQPDITVPPDRFPDSVENTVSGTESRLSVEEAGTCHRCGAITHGYHESTNDCVDTLVEEMRMLQDRIRYLQGRRAKFSGGRVDEDCLEHVATAASYAAVNGTPVEAS
jgi:PAS domain-containing protein